MSDPKVDGPSPAPDWQQPDAAQAQTADQSFNDDVVAARMKMQEAALARLAQDRLTHELPREVLSLHQKVEKAGAFARAGNRSDEPKARPRDTGGVPARSRAEARRAGGHAAVDPTDALEARVGAVMERVSELEERAHQGAQAAEQQLPDARAARLLHLDMVLRLQLQQLVAGQLGFRLLADPRLAFRRLFSRIKRWPRRVRPGRRPETDDEFDAFLAWVFAPPPQPDDVDEPFALTSR